MWIFSVLSEAVVAFKDKTLALAPFVCFINNYLEIAATSNESKVDAISLLSNIFIFLSQEERTFMVNSVGWCVLELVMSLLISKQDKLVIWKCLDAMGSFISVSDRFCAYVVEEKSLLFKFHKILTKGKLKHKKQVIWIVGNLISNSRKDALEIAENGLFNCIVIVLHDKKSDL